MSFFTDLFTSYSPFQEKVAACSDEQLEAPDMLANLEICDVVSVSKPAAKECYEVVRKRMMMYKEAGGRVSLLTLDLIEMLVKNCGFHFFSLVARQEFLDDLVKLVKKEKCPSAVRDKVLLLIMSWGEAFAHMQDVYPSFHQTFQYLRTDPTVEFPARDTTAMSPIFTPPPSVAPVALPASSASNAALYPGVAGGVARQPGLGQLPPTLRQQEQQLRAQQQQYGQFGQQYYQTAPATHAPLPPIEASPLSDENSTEYQDKLKHELQLSHNLMLMTREILAASAGDGWLLIKGNELLNALVPKLRKITKRLNALLHELAHEQLVALCIAVSEYIAQTLAWHTALVNDKPYAPPQPLLPLLDISAANSEVASAAEAAAQVDSSASAAAAVSAAPGAVSAAEVDILGLHAPAPAAADIAAVAAAAPRVIHSHENEVKVASCTDADDDDDPFANLANRDVVRASASASVLPPVLGNDFASLAIGGSAAAAPGASSAPAILFAPPSSASFVFKPQAPPPPQHMQFDPLAPAPVPAPALFAPAAAAPSAADAAPGQQRYAFQLSPPPGDDAALLFAPGAAAPKQDGQPSVLLQEEFL